MQLFWGVKHDNDTIIIEGEEVVHLNKSLRKQQGDLVNLIDGTGPIFQCELTQVSRSQAIAKIVKSISNEKKWTGYLHIGIALTKNIDRIEWFVEKAVEMGIDEISFLDCDRSEKSKIRMDRILRIVQSSMKQSLNTLLPKINDIVSLSSLLTQSAHYQIKLIPHCEDLEKVVLTSALKPSSETIVLIGPEGDFTSNEIGIAISHGFMPASMGDTRLRTETAGMMAVAIFQSRNWS